MCLERLAERTSLALLRSHRLHCGCVEGLRSYGIRAVWPMCREELPLGPEQLFGEGCRLAVPYVLMAHCRWYDG